MTTPESPRNESVLRKPLTGPQILLALVAVAVLIGLFFSLGGRRHLARPLTKDGESRRLGARESRDVSAGPIRERRAGEGRYLSQAESQKAFQHLFQQADRLEICAEYWPGERDKMHLLGTVSRKKEAARWETWIAELAHAGPPPNGPRPAPVCLRLYQGSSLLQDIRCWPHTNLLAALPDGHLAEIAFDCSLNDTLRPFLQNWEAARDRAWQAEEAKRPPTAGQYQPPTRLNLEESKKALQDLFRQADRCEIYVHGWPGEELHRLGAATRKEAPGRWNAWIRDLGNAREPTPKALPPTVRLWLYKGSTKLGEVDCSPSHGRVFTFLSGNRVAHVELDSSLNDFLLPFQQERVDAARRAWEDKRAKTPPPAPMLRDMIGRPR